MDQRKVFCRCVEGHCFLEKDAEWAKQNHAQALYSNLIYTDCTLLDALDAGRLHAKNEWMDSLGVSGIYQVCCGHEDREKLLKSAQE